MVNHTKWNLKLLIIDADYADFIQEKYYADRRDGGYYLGCALYITGIGFFFDSMSNKTLNNIELVIPEN